MVEITEIVNAFGQALRMLPPHIRRRAIARRKLPDILRDVTSPLFGVIASKNAPEHHERGIVYARPLSTNTT